MQENKNNPPFVNPAIEALNKALQEQIGERNEQVGLFLVKDGNTWLKEASQKPIPGRLFGEMWYTGELCILFADTNTGKSILAVQIADSISRGVAVHGFALEEPAQPVVYFDFELADKQFEMRYSINSTQHYSFSHNFYRAEIDPDAEIPDYERNFELFLNQSIENALLETGAKVLVIDNITYLKTETERAKEAAPLMKHLIYLKKKYDLSIMVLAHTPKRDMSQPITSNHLQGSRMLMNFADASFCIGVSRQDKNLRYLKQVKIRDGELRYDSENVAICIVEKPANFLKFTFMNYGSEREHLAEVSENSTLERKAEAKRLRDEGKVQREIASIMNKSVSTINGYLNS